MGQGITLTCNKCFAEDYFQMGIGFSYYSLENVFSITRGKSKKIIKELIEKQQIHHSQFSHKAFACKHCNTLHNRFHVKIEHGDDEIFETQFICNECRKALEVIDKELKEIAPHYNCRKCGAKGLEHGLHLFWD